MRISTRRCRSWPRSARRRRSPPCSRTRLAPICGASFTRITAELRLSENTSCMICGDVGDLTGGGRTALLCELELELKQGSEEALSAFARALMDTYHLSEQPLSKLQRARALAE